MGAASRQRPLTDGVRNLVLYGSTVNLNHAPFRPFEIVSGTGVIAGTAAAVAIGGTVIVGNLISFPVSETISDQHITEKQEKGNYKDGVYTGVGEGFRGTTEVQVTVENGYIADMVDMKLMNSTPIREKSPNLFLFRIVYDIIPF